MSNNNDFPLSLDELRPVTRSPNRKDDFSSSSGRRSARSPVSREAMSTQQPSPGERGLRNFNYRLLRENRLMREALTTMMENSGLQTMKILATFLSTQDEKLRKFLTENLFGIANEEYNKYAKENSHLNTSRPGQSSTGSYGKSFAKVGLSDLGSSSFTPSTVSTLRRRSPSPSARYYDQSPRKQLNFEEPSSFPNPPMKFGYGRSPYQKSPLKTSSVGASYRRENKYDSLAATDDRASFSRTEQRDFGTDSGSSSRAFWKTKLVPDHLASSSDKKDRFCTHCHHALLPGCGCHPPKDQSAKHASASYSALSQDKTKGLSSESYYQTARSTGHSSQCRAEYSSDSSSKSGTYKPGPSPSLGFQTTNAEIAQNKQDESSLKNPQQTKSLLDSLRPKIPFRFMGSLARSTKPFGLTDLLSSDDQQAQGREQTMNTTFRRGTAPVPVATSTPLTSTERPTSSPLRTPGISLSWTETANKKLFTESMADVMGFKGLNSSERAKYVVHRPVDILTSYHPNISRQVSDALATTRPNKRIVGEIAFQLDRRILEYVFLCVHNCSKRRSRYYGYSVSTIMQLIEKEVFLAGDDGELEKALRLRLDLMLQKLGRIGYDLERHAVFTQDMVNKYGLIHGQPDPSTLEGFGLTEPAVLRVILAQVLREGTELHNMLIILDCLLYMAYEDGKPLFVY